MSTPEAPVCACGQFHFPEGGLCILLRVDAMPPELAQAGGGAEGLLRVHVCWPNGTEGRPEAIALLQLAKDRMEVLVQTCEALVRQGYVNQSPTEVAPGLSDEERKRGA